MTLTQYVKSLSRRCSVLGVEPPSPSMAAAYRNAGYSPREAAGLELDEYIEFKRALKQHDLYCLYSAVQGDNH
jgi:hypothetical protein